MNNLLSRISASGYVRILKPLLFLIKPDPVHNFAIRSGVFLEHHKVLRDLFSYSWAYSNQARLGQTIAGITVKNPIGLSAGFDKNIELPGVMRAIGFGFMEGGTVTNQPYSGNRRPWFYRLPHSQSLVVRAGLANQGADRIIQRLQSSKNRSDDFPVNISVAHTNVQKEQPEGEMIEDTIHALKKIVASKTAQLITLNISCPNTFNGEVFTKPEALDRLLTAVDTLQLPQPTFLKMPCDLSWGEFDGLLKIAAKHRIEGVTICNLTGNTDKVSKLDTLSNQRRGGMSGKLVYEKSNQLIAKTYRSYGSRFIIIGVGGVFTAADAYKKIRLGASLVEMITGMIFQGPQVVGRLNKELVGLIEKDGFTSITDAVGIDARKGSTKKRINESPTTRGIVRV